MQSPMMGNARSALSQSPGVSNGKSGPASQPSVASGNPGIPQPGMPYGYSGVGPVGFSGNPYSAPTYTPYANPWQMPQAYPAVQQPAAVAQPASWTNSRFFAPISTFQPPAPVQQPQYYDDDEDRGIRRNGDGD